MKGDNAPLNPLVVGRGGGEYAVTNIDMTDMSPMQRLAVAVMTWDQFRMLMEHNGEYRPSKVLAPGRVERGLGDVIDIDRVCAKACGVAPTALNRIRPRLKKRPEIIEQMLANALEGQGDVERALGYRVINRLTDGRTTNWSGKSGFIGKGDKFDEATEPLLRYLRKWEKHGFEYPHVNPTEARKRLKRIEKLSAQLDRAKEDLSRRSHRATLRAPS